MPRVVFTSNLQRHVDCPEHSVRGATVRAALEEVFKAQPRVRDYVLDEQGHTRKHVVIFVEGQRAALLVNDILGQQQVVIKSLEANYREVPGVAAATILGDGRVALILDINSRIVILPPGDG